ncbi:MAG: C40 family peptidase [Bacteroidetes bacterium]|nr:C40 family peptidase [Bacteroidota bacterium]
MKTILVRFVKAVILLFLVVIFQAIPSCRSESKFQDFQNIIDRISIKWVPDQREGIAGLTVHKQAEKIIIKGETNCPQLIMEVLDSLSAKGYEVIDSVLVLPGNDVGEYKYGIATLSVINLRREPEHSAELVSQSILGTPVKVLKNSGYWILVQTPDKYIAWSEKVSFQLMNEAEFNEWKNARKVIYIENTGWIYESIEEKGVIGDIVAGSIMKSGGKSGSWEKVILPDGREGYVRGKTVVNYCDWKNRLTADGPAVLRIASSLMGIPYLWGGSSSKGVDCSGFAQTAYFMNGIILSRDASLLALHGQPVDISDGWNNLNTGDLMFFGSIRNSKPRVTHVAIYKGDSEFIHSAGRVMVNSLDSTRSNYSSYRRNSFLSARRISGSVSIPGIVAVRDHELY